MKNKLSIRQRLESAVLIILLTGLASRSLGQTNADPYLWLEQVQSDRALQWVRSENAKTLDVLEKDPRYSALYSNALALAQDKDRIPTPEIIAGQVFNFWQDADHVRGIYRRTSMQSYESPTPGWTTVLDVDALAKDEKANWVWEGLTVDQPSESRAMVELSDGGEDAVTVREFDLPSTTFVKNGFDLPRAKQRVAWEDADTLLVARANDAAELTASGYPYLVRRLKRGQGIQDAPIVFRGEAKDGGYGVTPAPLRDGMGHTALLVVRPLTTFEAEQYLWTGGQFAKLGLPRKARVEGLVQGRLLVNLREDWSADGATFHQGSLADFDLAAALQDPAHLHPRLVYAPGPRESLGSAAASKDALVVTTLENVRGRAFVYRFDATRTWRRDQLGLADNCTISVVDTDIHTSAAFLNVTGFLQPSSLWTIDTDSLALKEAKTLPPKFDASGDVVEQFEAVSSDGTKIPYFLVHPTHMALDGNNPAILTAYGGFQISRTPAYSATIGKLWLERGGVYVLANIRGGGEFGPAWHEAGLKTHRQIIYNDFAAVARDLIARKITSPRRLGIQGGSNGGLLMGVEMTQHPELWNAVDIAVPLLDMERFEQIAAGTSWVGEYGSMSNPAERAFLSSISPYANLRRGVAYPQPLIWTTTKDDRVGPQHARKFAARLAEYGVPYYYYEVIEGGHSSGANLKERARTTALEMIYFTRKLMD
jgi:prolyl oligopeptidase